jgi:anti-sigma B factor antagonist
MFHHPAIDIQQREEQGITILDLRGKLDMGQGDVALRDFVCSLLQQGNRQLVLDLAHVSDIDTAGSGVLLFLAQEYRTAGGRLALEQVGHAHVAIYEMARLETVVEIYANELDAINSFFPDRVVPHYDILEYVESHTQHEALHHDKNNQDKDHKA